MMIANTTSPIVAQPLDNYEAETFTQRITVGEYSSVLRNNDIRSTAQPSKSDRN